MAMDCLPVIEQVFVSGQGLDERAFGIKLFWLAGRLKLPCNLTKISMCAASLKR